MILYLWHLGQGASLDKEAECSHSKQLEIIADNVIVMDS